MTAQMFYDIEVPAELEPSLLRHREHLAQLVFTLRSAGMDDAAVEQSVSIMMASYKRELIQTVKKLVRYGD